MNVPSANMFSFGAIPNVSVHNDDRNWSSEQLDEILPVESALAEPIGQHSFFDDDELDLDKPENCFSGALVPPSNMNSLVAMLSRPPPTQQQQQAPQRTLCHSQQSMFEPYSITSLPMTTNMQVAPVITAPLPHRARAPAGAANKDPQFKPVQEEKWTQRLSELELFRKQHGHTLVPHLYKPNLQLARWVKRQRRQFKLRQEGKTSTLSDERVALLEDLGFVWDSHSATYSQKVQELLSYKARHGNCLVPSTYKANPQLAIWVKCQRRQYKLWKSGRNSSMTAERAASLEQVGFVFEVRATCSSSSRPSSPATITPAVAPVSTGETMLDSDMKRLFDTISQL